MAIDEEEAFLQLAMEARGVSHDLSPRDRGLALEIAAGVERWRRWLDHHLTPFLQRGVEGTAGPLLQILRMGAYQLLRLDRVPDHAAVDSAVELARSQGGAKAAGFVNGVLRALLRGRDEIPAVPEGPEAEAVAVRLSHPDWLVSQWIEAHGVEFTEALCAADNTPAPLVIRADGPARSGDELAALLKKSKAEVEPGAYVPEALTLAGLPRPFGHQSFHDGWWQAQDEGSQLAALLLAPGPNHAVWEACAAPGGKSSLLAREMGLSRPWISPRPTGSLWSTDVHPAKARRLAQRLDKIEGVTVDRHDATRTPEDRTFDRILVDAPCTGLGLLRRHPEIKWRRKADDVADAAQMQQRILEAAAAALKPGGVLVYSVCSVTEAEGPEIVRAFLADHPEFERAPSPCDDPEGVSEIGTAGQVPWADLLDDNGELRLWPHVHGTDGFFAARLRRKAEA